MAFGGFSKSAVSTPMAEINMIPLIDVMLVLLVIFIVTAPLLTHGVKIELPRASSAPVATPPETIQLAIRDTGEVFWNGERLAAADLDARLRAAAESQPQPDVHLRADRATEYRRIAAVMAATARAGLVKIAFVTDPAAQP